MGARADHDSATLRPARRLLAALVVFGSGCGLQLPASSAASPPEYCNFPSGVAIVWAGESSLVDLGLPAQGIDDPEAQAEVWVTRDRIHLASSREASDVRAWCRVLKTSEMGVQFDNGEVPAEWTPPLLP